MVMMSCSKCGYRREVKPQALRRNGYTVENNLCRRCSLKHQKNRVWTNDRSHLNYLLELAKIRKLHLEAKRDDSG